MDILNRRALVTGASRGLGRTLVFALAAAGTREVIAGVRKAEDLEKLRQDAAAARAAVTPIRLDVTSDEDVNTAAGLGPVDLLINNAGVAGFGNPVTMSFEAIQKEVAVNYLGVLRVVRAFAPAMIEQGNGVIVNIATPFAKVNLPIVGTYCATKAALFSLGQALRAHLNDKGVRVITVLPATIDTDMSRGADVPKMTKDFVAAEILRAIRDEAHDPAIGQEAEGILQSLSKDPLGVEKLFAQYK